MHWIGSPGGGVKQQSLFYVCSQLHSCLFAWGRGKSTELTSFMGKATMFFGVNDLNSVAFTTTPRQTNPMQLLLSTKKQALGPISVRFVADLFNGFLFHHTTPFLTKGHSSEPFLWCENPVRKRPDTSRNVGLNSTKAEQCDKQVKCVGLPCDFPQQNTGVKLKVFTVMFSARPLLTTENNALADKHKA